MGQANLFGSSNKNLIFSRHKQIHGKWSVCRQEEKAEAVEKKRKEGKKEEMKLECYRPSRSTVTLIS